MSTIKFKTLRLLRSLKFKKIEKFFAENNDDSKKKERKKNKKFETYNDKHLIRNVNHRDERKCVKSATVKGRSVLGVIC